VIVLCGALFEAVHSFHLEYNRLQISSQVKSIKLGHNGQRGSHKFRKEICPNTAKWRWWGNEWWWDSSEDEDNEDELKNQRATNVPLEVFSRGLLRGIMFRHPSIETSILWVNFFFYFSAIWSLLVKLWACSDRLPENLTPKIAVKMPSFSNAPSHSRIITRFWPIREWPCIRRSLNAHNFVEISPKNKKTHITTAIFVLK
jgi:hypothetical protein